MKKLLVVAILVGFYAIISGGKPANAFENLPGIYLAQQNQESSAKDDQEAEDDEDFEDDQEFEDEVTVISDPLYNLNGIFYIINDQLYVIILRPAAKAYNFLTPQVFRKVVSNFFYNLRFPIRFVNCLLQFKGTKAAQELGGFLMNTTFGVLGFRS